VVELEEMAGTSAAPDLTAEELDGVAELYASGFGLEPARA
jgi:hypothetical protein